MHHLQVMELQSTANQATLQGTRFEQTDVKYVSTDADPDNKLGKSHF